MPFYRMVAADARAPRDGKFLEVVSFCQPTMTTRNSLFIVQCNNECDGQLCKVQELM